jgi:hypothetical protein
VWALPQCREVTTPAHNCGATVAARHAVRVQGGVFPRSNEVVRAGLRPAPTCPARCHAGIAEGVKSLNSLFSAIRAFSVSVILRSLAAPVVAARSSPGVGQTSVCLVGGGVGVCARQVPGVGKPKLTLRPGDDADVYEWCNRMRRACRAATEGRQPTSPA